MGIQLSLKTDRAPPHFSAHVYCGQMAVWIKMPLGTQVDFGPGHTVLDGAQLPPKKGAQQPLLFFWPMSIVAKRSPVSATAKLLYSNNATIFTT